MSKSGKFRDSFTTLNVFVLCLIIVFAVFVVVNFIVKPFDYDRKSTLIGDRVCGSLGEDLRNGCCADAHAKDATADCLGEWRYSDKCSFVCFSELELAERKCSAAGGDWFEFPNGCVDSCELARNPESISCTQALTFSCDCGPDSCWNGESCENN